jgi:hypothetical protein
MRGYNRGLESFLCLLSLVEVMGEKYFTEEDRYLMNMFRGQKSESKSQNELKMRNAFSWHLVYAIIALYQKDYVVTLPKNYKELTLDKEGVDLALAIYDVPRTVFNNIMWVGIRNFAKSKHRETEWENNYKCYEEFNPVEVNSNYFNPIEINSDYIQEEFNNYAQYFPGMVRQIEHVIGFMDPVYTYNGEDLVHEGHFYANYLLMHIKSNHKLKSQPKQKKLSREKRKRKRG